MVNQNPGLDSNRWVVTVERAEQGAPGPERRTDPRAHGFQGINRLLEALLLPHLVAQRNHNRVQGIQASIGFRVKVSVSRIPHQSFQLARWRLHNA